MALVQMVMPKMGESVMEGTILNWLKKVGDRIEQDESVLEVATDKVDTEVPAIHAGVLVEILVQKGDVVPVGNAIAVIDTGGDSGSGAPVASGTGSSASAQPQKVAKEPVAVVEEAPSASSDKFYSPLVMNIARQEGISMSELDKIQGSGRDGRVNKNDILAYVEKRKQQPQVPAATPQPQVVVKQEPIAQPQAETKVEQVKPAASYSGAVDIVEMDRMRKMIAQRMVDSKRISPHVTSFVEADVTNVVNWRNKWKHVANEKYGTNLTFTPIFIEAVVKALQDFPMINSSIENNERVIVKKYINIGMATALPNGNLIVPVIKNANHLNLLGLTAQVNDLAKRARNNKLSPDDLSDGTYTVSNIGNFGNMLGTPIIMQPQVAILSLGAVVKKPAVIETPQGDVIGIRHMMFLSHSYDHRIVDGALGGMFVRKVADYLEKFDVNRSL